MIGTVANVIRGEGVQSALRRARERVAEAAETAMLRARAWTTDTPRATILNFIVTPATPRYGGVPIQLLARLREERRLRDVALLHPGGLRMLSPTAHERRIGTVADAIAATGAAAVHLEGTFGAPLEELGGIPLVVSVHDFSLWSEPSAAAFLRSASTVVFPSQFLLDRHRERFEVDGVVIEPALSTHAPAIAGKRDAIAFAGSVKEHKGGALLPDIARRLGSRGIRLHVFGGGDLDLLRPLRREPNVVVHGYYASGSLPALLARHRVGLVLLPSIVAESFSLTLSEAWLGGAAVAAFDHGAIAERIRRHGGGFLAPLESQTEGIIEIADRWASGRASATIPRLERTSADAARDHVELYRTLGLAGTSHSAAARSS